jgi:mannose-6-phosphate isomerase-like protein (cupin superfamily)
MQFDVGQPVLLRPEAGEGETVVDQPRRTLRILLAHELLDATWTRHEGGERGAEPHVHHQHTDAFYVLEGELTFQVEEAVITKRAGELAFAPRGVAHTFANHSDAPARYVLVCTPAGFERYFGRMTDDPPEWALQEIPFEVERVGPQIGRS